MFIHVNNIVYKVNLTNKEANLSELDVNKWLPETLYEGNDAYIIKGSDWIRLVFAHPFPLNSRAPIASANFIAHGKVQVSPYDTLEDCFCLVLRAEIFPKPITFCYGHIWGCFLMMEPAPLMWAPLFKTNGWAQSSPYPVSPFELNGSAIAVQTDRQTDKQSDG